MIHEAVKKEQPTPESADLLKLLFEQLYIYEYSQVFAGIEKMLDIPVVFLDKPGFVAAYIANVNKENNLENERIVFASELAEVFRKKRDYGIRDVVKELMFIYKHELLHVVFDHIRRSKNEWNDLPVSLVNFAIDIFINTLIKYHDKDIINVNNLVTWKSVARYYEDLDAAMIHFSQIENQLNKYGLYTSKEELKKLIMITSEEVEKLDDEQLVNLLRDLFDNLFKFIDNAINEGLEQSFSKKQGSGNNNQNDNNNSVYDFIQDVTDYVDNKINKEINNNKDFANMVKKFVANFNSLPDIPSSILQKVFGQSNNVQTPQNEVDYANAVNYLRNLVTKAEKTKGTVPGFIRSLSKIAIVKIAYADVIETFGKRVVGMSRKTYSPPSKKSPKNVLLPTWNDYSPKIAFVVDTSGSMSEEEISTALGHVSSLISRAKETVVYFNDADYQKMRFRKGRKRELFEAVKKGFQGGGGSVFTDVFAEKEIANCDIVIFFSDFFIDVNTKPIRLKPTILIHTESYDSSVLEKMRTEIKTSLVIPATN